MKKRTDAANLLNELNSVRKDGIDPVTVSISPEPGQLHSLAVETDMWEEFVLVLEKNDDTCQVIPGSMNAMKGGPDDILIPDPDSDALWMLSLPLVTELPTDALLPAFAKIPAGMLEYIRKGVEKAGKHEPLDGSYRFCLPYIGTGDSRIDYHERLSDLLRKAEMKNRMDGFTFRPLWDNEESMALAAGSEKGIIQKKCVVEGREELLSLKYSPEKDAVWIYVFSADRSGISAALDGTEIIDSDERVLGTIQAGECRLNVERGFDGRIALRLKDGTIRLLKSLS
ncbi:MAG: hypothetical protein J6Y92_05900 [Lentisphaeria bacterium]|nr:hypothetical protein [Lentisphaeria bacterium]